MKNNLLVLSLILLAVAVLSWLVCLGFWGYHTFQWNLELNKGLTFGPHFELNQIWFMRLIVTFLIMWISVGCFKLAQEWTSA